MRKKQTQGEGRGFFISIEGGEGAGKTTIIEQIEKYWAVERKQMIVTREPGGIEIAEKIRELILEPTHRMDGKTEALLYAAARRQHLVEKVVPALSAGITILSDRFIDSSLAYQGHARGIGIDEVYNMNQFAIENCMPDLTIYLDVPPKVGLERIYGNKQREINRLDLEDLNFHHKVREGFLLLLERFPERIVKIDANRDMNQVWQDTLKLLEKYL